VDGCKQILWGLFQKVVIADNLAAVINDVWGDLPGQSSSTLFLTAILFSIQLYTDFSGYSHMAIGVGKILGIQITKNFNYPFFSRSIDEFWRNWHISLTSWLTEYIFMPLNIKFRNLGKLGIILAIIANMVVVGVWHGPNWTFALFGLYNGLLFIPLIISDSFFEKKKLKPNKYGLPTLKDLSKMIGTFLLITLGLILFRADDIGQAMGYISDIFSNSLFTIPEFEEKFKAVRTVVFIVFFFAIEWKGRLGIYAIDEIVKKWNNPIRWSFYSLLILAIGMFMASDESPFIYFQF
jgi:alginate O-acetyltransferase complex protein AlgI